MGLWEHARLSTPRREHGFCIDDNARALVIVTREEGTDLSALAGVYLGFVLAARRPDGRFHERRLATGSWIEGDNGDDSQGRAWWGLGAIAERAPEPWMETTALEEFESCATFESPHLRANAYAALGAAAVMGRDPCFRPAIELLDRTSAVIARAARAAIPWPEPRLTYDNARIPEALLAAGIALDDERRTRLGIRLLAWLTLNETRGGKFSFTPVGGRAPGERRSGFDQQPIEAWAMADACYRVLPVTPEARWRKFAISSATWLLGENDSEAVLYEERTGGTYDGLTPTGINSNQGAESTLAGLGVLQIAAKLRSDTTLF